MGDTNKYAQWIVDNQDKQGTPEFETVAKAYKASKSSQPALKSYTAGESLQSAAEKGFGVGNMITQALEAAKHPVDTLSGLARAGAGGLDYLTGGILKETSPKERAINKEIAKKVGEDYAQYGTWEGAKRKFAEHPESVLSDLSTVLGGAGMATKGTKLGNLLTTASEYTNPLKPVEAVANLAGKGIGGVTTGLIGTTTGTSPETLRTAYQAGKEGNPAYWENLTGKANMEDVVDQARMGLQKMRQVKNEAYKSSMEALKNDKTMLGFEDVDNSLNEAYKQFAHGEGGLIKNTKVKSVLDDVNNALNEWKNSDNPLTRTPQAFDDMKQRVGGILESLPFNEKTARTAVGKVYNSIKDTIKAQAPTYEKTMKDYGEAAKLVDDIQSAFSLKDTNAMDTAIRKLQSLTRNNASTNYGNRLKLAEELKNVGGQDIMPALAGQATNDWFPRGMIGKGEELGVLGTLINNPSKAGRVLATLPIMSPKIMGATYYGLGKAAGKTPELPITVDQANKLALALYQMRNRQEEQ